MVGAVAARRAMRLLLLLDQGERAVSFVIYVDLAVRGYLVGAADLPGGNPGTEKYKRASGVHDVGRGANYIAIQG